MKDEQRMDGVVRNPSPCKGCGERFTACGDRCPKDLRGEYGYKAWKADIEEVKQKRKQYIKNLDYERKRDKWVFGK